MPSLRLLLPLFAALALPAGASAATVTVNPGDNVDEKVDSAAAGDTVVLKAGQHNGAVSVSDADVTITGEAGAFLLGLSTGTAPTIDFQAANGTLTDLTVLSTVGTGVQFSGGGNGKVLRSTLASVKADGIALSTIAGAADTGRTLTVDSTVLVGKTALLGQSSAPFVPVLSEVTTRVTARHVTAIGAVTVNAAVPTADVAATVLDSIVRGTRSAGVTAAADRNSVADTPADAATLFVRPAAFNYHLRADAPVIDKGQVTTGESDKDVDGQARTAGSASDYGADEFHNRAPVAKLAAPAGAVRQGIPATFSAAESSDPEAAIGGGVTSYIWDFGDGTTETTSTPTVAHAFGARQGYTVTVRVTDKQGATSDAASVPVTVVDGTAPQVTIGQPGAKQRITLYNKAKKGKKAKRRKVLFFGTATDDTALGSVVLALRKVAVKGGKCAWYNGKKGFTKADCTAPVTLTPTLTNGQWRYTLPRTARLPRGPYQLYAIAVDASGLAGPAQTVAFRFR